MEADPAEGAGTGATDGGSSGAGLDASSSGGPGDASSDPAGSSGAPEGPVVGTSGGVPEDSTGASSGGGTSTGEPMVAQVCDGVVAADHPPFEAIQRLATTDEEVRVLVYGQSISEQAWWEQTRDWLTAQYPGGNLVMEEHARGGCSAQCLVGRTPWFVDGQTYNRLPFDVFAWQPDLVIFHVYGDHIDYGYIMDALSNGCASFDGYESSGGNDVPSVHCTPDQLDQSSGYAMPEVLVQGDHRWAGNYPETCADPPGPDQWGCFMNEVVIPGHVETYGYEFQDNWHEWAAYIEDNAVDPETLTNAPDDIHLSEVGNSLMFQSTIPHLCYVPR
ncbi:MAG: hypothetical protein AAF721_08930 [Myxococcota bacterium]